MPKKNRIAASDARNNFSELISKVQYQKQIYLVERYGEVVAMVVPFDYQPEPIETVADDDGGEGDSVSATSIEPQKEEREEKEKKTTIESLPPQKPESTEEANNLRDELRNLREVVRVTTETVASEEVLAQNHTTKIEDQKEGVVEEQESQSAARSALKKLEELIEARKRQREVVVQDGEKEQPQVEGEAESSENQERSDDQIGDRAQTQNQAQIQDQDEQDKPEIIRKKIEL